MTRPPLGRAVTAALTAALVVLLSTALLTPASAATGTYLRLAHLSPDTPNVDVTVTSFSGESTELAGVGYGDVSTYTRIEPGTYTVQMRLSGAPATDVPLVTGTLEATEGSAYTAAGLGPRAELAVNVLSDDLTPPAAGQARVRVVQGAEQAGAVGILWNAVPLADSVAFGTATDYATVPAGTGTFDVTPAGGAPVALPTDLAGGGVYSVILVQRDGALVPEVTVDAVGPGAVPQGGIETGFGGTAVTKAAGSPEPAPWATGLAVAVAACGVLGIGLVRRARR